MERELDWPSPLTRDQLRTRWYAFCRSVDARDTAIDTAWDAIERAYTEPVRRHHTLEHLGEVFALLDALSPSGTSRAVEVAAWTHDIVYDPSRSDNEVNSAARGRDQLSSLGLTTDDIERVERLVVMTASHRADPSDGDAQLLADVDLAVLGSPPERYERYVADIRAEYAHLDEATWRRGRDAVITTFLELPAIYHHPRLQPWNARARHNLAEERRRLRHGT